MKRKAVFFLLVLACAAVSCLPHKPELFVSMSLVPPTTVTSKVNIEVMGEVGNDSDKALEGVLKLKIENLPSGHCTVLDSMDVTVPVNEKIAYEHTFPTASFVGDNTITLSFEAGGKTCLKERRITIEPSDKRSRGTIDGAWIGLYHWSEIEGRHWNDDIRKLTAEDWRGVVRSMHGAGMDIIVLQELFRNQEYVGRHDVTAESYSGRAFYPSELYSGRMPIACSDPVEAILDEASGLGMHVFMGVGLFAWFDFSEESLKWHKAVTEELLEMYGHHDAFYGLYVSEECVGSLDNCEPTEELRLKRTEEIISFFREYKAFCRELAPSKPIMLATNSMGLTGREDEYMRLLENLDILCPFGFARMPEGDLTGYEAAMLLQECCDRAGSHFWFDLESFLFNPDTSLYPRPIEQILGDLNMFDNFEKVLCYQYPGVFNNPELHPLIGDPRSVELYNSYLDYLKSKIVPCSSAGTDTETYTLSSPSGKLHADILAGEEVTYSLSVDGREIVAPSPLAMILEDGTVWGRDVKVRRAVRESVRRTVPAEFYRSSEVREEYNSLVLKMKGRWSIEFRAYDDGLAYRFISNVRKPFRVKDEIFSCRFSGDCEATVPYVLGGTDYDWDSQFYSAFENLYTVVPLSEMNRGRLSFLPVAVNPGNGLKICLTEVNLYDYPGLYLYNRAGGNELNGMFAPYPLKVEPGGYKNIEAMVRERAGYIASVDGPRAFPWRVAVAGTDAEVASSDLTWLLAEPSRIEDTDWICPGQAAWDWWNCWNITGVDFEVGINTETYKHYIDFASAQGLEYFLIDDGWAEGDGGDLMKVNPAVNLEEVVDYAGEKGVKIILWAGYLAFEHDMENICRHYSEMGVKGFKVDFMDRDDQLMTGFNRRAAETAAEYGLILNLHGSHKPAGITRTWPNVLNVEGVYGLENVKVHGIDYDHIENDVTIPFIRQVAGPMDYTPGAMVNGTKETYRCSYDKPMSQGTRCHQMALYVVLDSPLCMLCDTPVNYRKEVECTDFISSVPTVWDETRVLAGEMGEYIVTARRKGAEWYVGGLTDWNAREIRIDLSSLGTDACNVEIYHDGPAAERNASDYVRDELELSGPLTVRMAPGGGFVLRLR